MNYTDEVICFDLGFGSSSVQCNKIKFIKVLVT